LCYWDDDVTNVDTGAMQSRHPDESPVINRLLNQRFQEQRDFDERPEQGRKALQFVNFFFLA